ncbi:MAG: hypothetical protein H7Z41_09625 [Cytophagales bacterium]|nr:hypothetical protein [Armatimonadota bacterium]
MALSQPISENNMPAEAAPPPPEAAIPDAPSVLDDAALKLDGLYRSASNLEVELEGIVRRGISSLTPGQIGGFNAIVRVARELLPKSVALREDADDVDATTRPADAHRALHVTIVPTLHNALPVPLYERHG